MFETAAMVIGKSHVTATRCGASTSTQIQLVAVYEKIDGAMRLAYFQSTDLPCAISACSQTE